MATVNASRALDFDEIDFHELDNANDLSVTSSVVRVVYGGGLDRATFTGSGFVFDGGTPKSGSVTGLGHEVRSNGAWVTTWTLSGGAPISIVSVDNAVASIDLTDDRKLLAQLLSRADSFVLSGAADDVSGFAGNDRIDGRGGNDRLDGGVGNDTLDGGDGQDTLVGGAGNDLLRGSAGNDWLQGGAGNDTLGGGAGNDRFDGGAGTDTVSFSLAQQGIRAAKPTDATRPGTATDAAGGRDVILIGAADVLVGSAYADVLTGSPVFTATWGEVFGDDDIRGGAGNDRINGLSGADELYGNAGNDRLDGGAGNDALFGNAGNDVLLGGAGENELHGGAGSDRLDGTGGVSYAVYADSTAAAVVNLATGRASDGLGGTDVLVAIRGAGGTRFADRLTGSTGANEFDGGAGNDTIDGGAGLDTVYFESATAAVRVNLTSGVALDGRGGRDSLVRIESAVGGSFADSLVGNAIANRLYGQAGNDTLGGAAGNDVLSGGAGADLLAGGAGNDALLGGAGSDVFRFNTGLDGRANVDRLSDFRAVDDRIELDDLVFTQAGARGALSQAAFRAGSAAADASDRVIYDAATGRLYYDADGSGAGAQILFATVAAQTVLGIADFVII